MYMLTGCYKVPAYRAMARVRLTNKTPCATYRAPGRFESTFVRGRLMDAVADKLGLDRSRCAGAISSARPRCLTSIKYNEPGIEELDIDSGDYAALLDKALIGLRLGQAAGRSEAPPRRRRTVGAGLAFFLEESGSGPTDNAKISVDPSGAVELITGGASIGQGFETAMAQIAAEALGVDYKRVRVIHGQTDLIDHGIGAHAARATGLTGGAVHVTAMLVREKALEFASELLQTPAADLDIVDGTVGRRNGRGGPSITLAEIAKRIAPGSKLLRGREPQLGGARLVQHRHTVFPYGAHLAVVRVDRDTGKITVERFMVAYDVGRAVNPMMIEGQLVGGCVAGARRRAVGGVRLRRDRRAAVGDLRRLSDADAARSSRRRGAADRGRALAVPSARAQGRRRRRHQRRRRRDRERHRRCARHARRGHAAAGDAAADAGVVAGGRGGPLEPELFPAFAALEDSGKELVEGKFLLAQALWWQ